MESTEQYTGPERRTPYTSEELQELRDATRTLADQVGGLSEAIQTVNELQRRQHELDTQVKQVQDESHDTKALSEHIVGQLHVIDDKAKTNFARWRALAVTLVIGVLTIIVVSAFFYLENDSVKHDIHDACVQRQESLKATVARELSLSRIDLPLASRPIHAKAAADYKKLIHPC